MPTWFWIGVLVWLVLDSIIGRILERRFDRKDRGPR